jgi:hypothetical protein
MKRLISDASVQVSPRAALGTAATLSESFLGTGKPGNVESYHFEAIIISPSRRRHRQSSGDPWSWISLRTGKITGKFKI